MEEIWKDCHLSNRYSISNLGNVFSKITNRLLTPCIKHGSYQVSLQIENKHKHCKVHRLVCYAFDNEFNHGVIKFKNNNKLDARFENLEYKKIDHFDNEIWKVCLLSENYLISNLGRVKNLKSGRILQPVLVKGYYSVNLVTQSKGNISKTITVHRLVMQAFKQDSYFEGAHINHINGIKTDNTLDNLEWCTIQENINHAFESGLNPNFIRYGEEHKSSKLKYSDIKHIKDSYEKLKNYTKVGKIFNVSDNTIRKIIKNKTWINN